MRKMANSAPAEFDRPAVYIDGMRFLVTAGNTRERLDEVRDWGNIFTGNTGLAIAREMARVGPVDLLTSTRAHLDALEHAGSTLPIHGIAFGTHAELRSLLADHLSRQTYDAVFMAAAVSDYRPAGTYRIVAREPEADGRERWTVESVQAGKVSGSYEQIAVRGERTEKLVDLFRTEWGYRGILVKFKLEVGKDREALLAIARQSRVTSGADYLVANTLDMVTGASAGAYLVSAEGAEWVARGDLARRLRAVVTPQA